MRQALPNRARCRTTKARINGFTVFVIVDFGFEGKPLGVTLKTAKAGSDFRRMMDGVGNLASNALQFGVPLADVQQNLSDIAPGYGEAFETACFPGRLDIDEDPE